MKRLAILTLVFNNYGTRLQSYALCKVLRRLFPEELSIEVINTEGAWSNRSNIINYIIIRSFKQYRLKAIGHIYEVIKFIIGIYKQIKVDHSHEIKKRNASFERIKSKIPYSDFYTLEDIRNNKLPKYDIIIVGSDQVWNGIKVGNQDVYMLDFLKGKKGLTYAASFGMTSIPRNMKADYKRRINNFESLLIREQEGIKLCHELGRNDAHLVLDPTLLLDASEYDELVSETSVVEGDFILVYSLNYSYKIFDEAYQLAKKNSCKMVVLKRSFCPPDINKYKNSIELYAESPDNFLWLIKNAKCIVTNSYHALLFSINFNRPFYLYLDNADEENSRLITIAEMCKLTNQIFWETGHLPSVINRIDYTPIMDVIEENRNRSIVLLEKSVRKHLN